MNATFKALSHPIRRRIVEMLREGPKNSGEIAAAFDVAWPTITTHLAVLKEAGLVEAEREGASIRYRLEISAVEETLAFLLELLGRAENPAALSSSHKEQTP